MLIAPSNPTPAVPIEATKIVVTLFLSSLIGLEREEHKANTNGYTFGGIRTYPLIGLLGYAIALVSGPQILPVIIGFAIVGSFLWLSYWHKLQSPGPVGVTTELSGLTTYIVGALVSLGHFWIAGAIAVISVLLLELKRFLEGLSQRIPAQEIFTFTKFLLLTVVILPIVPNQELGPYHINPFKTWLVVTAVSAISYGSYLLEIFTRGKGGVVLSAVLGGAYSSTLVTIVLAKRAKEIASPHMFSGGILMACGIMYLRLAVLVGIFNGQLLARILIPLLVLAAIGLGVGWIWTRHKDDNATTIQRQYVPRNPLELWAAFLFGGLFIAMLVVTKLALAHLGHGGLYGLAAIMGFTDVDPFVLSLTQSAGAVTSVALAAAAILIAAASNNVIKAFYAFIFSDRKTGTQALVLLVAFSILGVLPLIWVIQ